MLGWLMDVNVKTKYLKIIFWSQGNSSVCKVLAMRHAGMLDPSKHIKFLSAHL